MECFSAFFSMTNQKFCTVLRPKRYFLLPPLKFCLMRPYFGKYLKLKKSVFNSLLCACQVVEIRVNLADKIVKASCCLHNYLMRDFSLKFLHIYRRRVSSKYVLKMAARSWEPQSCSTFKYLRGSCKN